MTADEGQIALDAYAPAAFGGQLPELGFRAPAAAQAANVTYRQLDYWARTGMVEPSIQTAAGSGSQRLYSFRDIVVLKLVKRLLEAGISLRNIRTVIDQIRSRATTDLAATTLISDGASVYEATDSGDIVDLLAGGQCVFAVSVGHSVRETAEVVKDLPAVTGVPATTAAQQHKDELAARRAQRAS